MTSPVYYQVQHTQSKILDQFYADFSALYSFEERYTEEKIEPFG